MAATMSFKPGDLVRVKPNPRTALPGIHEVVSAAGSASNASAAAQERTVAEGPLRRA